MRKTIKHGLLALLFISLMTGCDSRQVIYYQYNGVTVTRVNDSNIDYFYYGKFDPRHDFSKEKNFVRTMWTGLGGYMSGLMVFYPDGKVEILRDAGDFEKFGQDTMLYWWEFDPYWKRFKWYGMVEGNYDSIARIFYYLKGEQEINERQRSRVKVTYPEGAIK